MTGVRAASLSDLGDESAVRVEVGGKPLCLARSQGEVEDCSIECWLHGSRFDLRTGQPTGLPATKPVATYPVTVEGDDVLVDVENAS